MRISKTLHVLKVRQMKKNLISDLECLPAFLQHVVHGSVCLSVIQPNHINKL